MNGLEALESKLTKLEDDYQHYTMVEKDKAIARAIKAEIELVEWCIKQAKVNKILKEKKVDTGLIEYLDRLFNWGIYTFTNLYNSYITSERALHYNNPLTEKEMLLIIEWQKENEQWNN